MDDKETLNRRARLRELIRECFEGEQVNLLDFIEKRTKKRPNQGELSSLVIDDGGKSFGDKKAKNLTEQIGLHRLWFNWKVGTHTEKEQWRLELLPSSYSNPPGNGADSNADPAPRLGSSVKVPVVGTTQLGDNGFWAEIEAPVGYGDGYVPHATRDSNAYALRCRGDSMKPRIKDDEFVVIEPNHTPLPGDEVLVKAKDGRVMVKELLYVRDDMVHLMSVNELHPKHAIHLKDIECMHYVSAIVKRPMWMPD